MLRRSSRDRVSLYRLLASRLLLALILFGLVGPFIPVAGAENGTRVSDLRWNVAGDVASITMRVSGPVRYRTTASARAIVLDIWSASIEAEHSTPVDRGVASAVALRQVAPEIVRLEVSLRERSRFKVYSRDDRMTLKVFPESQGTVPLPRSVSYQLMQVATGAGRARAHVVTIDPRAPGLEVRPALSGDVISSTERTSTAATRLEAFVAINASFYSGYSGLGLPVGLIVIDGRVLSAPLPRRPIFAMDTSGRPWIGSAEFSGRIVLENGAEVPISAINQPPRFGGVALYTPEYGPFTAPQAFIVIVREDRVVGISSGRPTIPHDGYALATAASQRFLLEGLTRGQPVKLQMALTPPAIRHALQGGPRLVQNGQVHVPYHWEGFGPAFYRARVARSAIGVTTSGKVLFVTVEQGNSTRSRRNRITGMSLGELATFMRSLGARDALNLDGGGSSTLVVGGRIVNALPRGERTVSATLMAVPRPVEKTP